MSAAESLNEGHPGLVALIHTMFGPLESLRFPSLDLSSIDLPTELPRTIPLLGVIVAKVNNHRHVGPESLRPLRQEWFYVVTARDSGWYEPHELFEDR